MSAMDPAAHAVEASAPVEAVGVVRAIDIVEKAIERRVLVIPGSVFSQRDTHFRLSFATNPAKLEEGLAILRELMQG